ncbi:MAG TPA: MarR family transcriptional regulator [Candidatus Sulfotelmatobacter sp.]|nr:MarR family transcriptional regulator [Candidatus Sulfotelmatobacter sp.]
MERSPEILAEARALRATVALFQRSLRAGRGFDEPSPEQMSVLGVLQREGPLTAGELGERERLLPQSLTRMLARLEDRGLITRRRDDEDRRRRLIAITLLGRQHLVAEALRREARLAGAMAHALSPAERDVLRIARDLLERLARYEGGNPG